MSEQAISRNSNIELFRFLSMIGVVLLHYNYDNYGAGFLLVKQNSINEYFMYILEFLSIGAVDSFLLISGFYNSRSNKRTLIKPIRLIIQTLVLSLLCCSLLYCSYNGNDFISYIVNDLSICWYISVYIALYLISPYLNLIIDRLSNIKLLVLVSLLLFLFSIEPALVELCSYFLDTDLSFLSFTGLLGYLNGYSLINAVLVYFIGALIYRNIEFIKKIPAIRFLLVYLLCSCVQNVSIFFSTIAYSYANPFVIAQAASLFCFFLVLPPRDSIIINTISKHSFAVYLTHVYFIRFICISEFVNKPAYIYILHALLSSILIYLTGWIIGFIYNLITDRLFKKLQNRFRFLDYDIGNRMIM